MKSLGDKTWDNFKFQILERSISIAEDKTYFFFCPELGVLNEKCRKHWIFSNFKSLKKV